MQFHPYGSTQHEYMLLHGLAKITRGRNWCCHHAMYAELRWKWHHYTLLRLVYTLHGPNMDIQARVGWCNSILMAPPTHIIMCPTVWPKSHVLEINVASMTYLYEELRWKWHHEKLLRLVYTLHGPNMDIQARFRWCYSILMAPHTHMCLPRFDQNHRSWKLILPAWHICWVEVEVASWQVVEAHVLIAWTQHGYTSNGIGWCNSILEAQHTHICASQIGQNHTCWNWCL